MVSKVLIKSLVVNVFLSIIKIIVSFLTNSKTLLADSIHTMSDLSTDIVGLIGSKLASKKPDESHPFGHGKIEYLTSLFISLFIIALGITIFKNSFSNKKMIFSSFIFIILPLTIILKFFVSNYLIKKGKELNSNILISSGTESKYDVINTIFAFTFIILSYFSKYTLILKYADMVGSIIISIITIRIGIILFLKNSKSIIGEIDLDQHKINSIKEILTRHKKIKKIKRITLLKYGSYISAIIDITMDSNVKLYSFYKIQNIIRKQIKKEYNQIKYIAINVKPSKEKK